MSVMDRRLFPSSIEETSTSSSRETPERDGPSPQNDDVSHDFITSQPGRDSSLHSYSSREATYRDEGPCPRNGISYNPIVCQPGRDDSLHSRPHNSTSRQNGTQSTSRLQSQPTKRTSLNHICIDVLPDGDSPEEEEEKENLIPQVSVVPKGKGSKEVGAAAPMTAKNVDPSLTKLLRGLPNSRRSGLMSCLPPSSKHTRKRAPLTPGRQPFDKRMKDFNFNSSDGEERPGQQPTRNQQLVKDSTKSLSPQSLRRGLFRV